MRNAFALARLLIVTGAFLTNAPCNAAENSEQDQYEEKAIARSAERAVRFVKSDRAIWVKVLEAEFPGRVGNPLKDEEYGAWYMLIAGTAEEWRKADVAGKPLAELFDRTIQRLELGPVPSIKRDEFMRYARKVLANGNPQSGSDANEEVDRVFRVLDRNGDGVLELEELTTKLREVRVRVDIDGNGRIDKDEYRTHYQTQVIAGAEAMAARDSRDKKSDPKSAASTTTNDFQQILTVADTDKDGQIALHEWRKAGRPIEVFMKMDLDEDGLMTRIEFARYTDQIEQENKAEVMKAEEMKTTAMKP